MNNIKTSLDHYCEQRQSGGLYWFLRSQAMRDLGMNENAFKLSAYRLIKKNKIARVRNDFFIIVPVEYRSVGSLPATWFIDDFFHYLNQPYYVALLTAASFLGVSHQQAMVFQVVTNKVMRPIVIGNIKIEFSYKKNIQTHLLKKIKTQTGYMQVSVPELTAYDLVCYLDAAGQINQVATVLSELDEQLDSSKLADIASANQVSVSAAQRLGYLLEFLGANYLTNELEKAISDKNRFWRPLVTGSDAEVMEENKRWRILVNEEIEVDDL